MRLLSVIVFIWDVVRSRAIGAWSADPEHVEDVDPSLLFEDQVGDHALAGGAEGQGADSGGGVGGVEGLTAPRADLEHDAGLGE